MKALLTPAQAALLLDQIVIDEVAECVDLRRLEGVETTLGALMLDVQGIDAGLAIAAARSMVRHALQRIADDPELLDHIRRDNNICALVDARCTSATSTQ